MSDEYEEYDPWGAKAEKAKAAGWQSHVFYRCRTPDDGLPARLLRGAGHHPRGFNDPRRASEDRQIMDGYRSRRGHPRKTVLGGVHVGQGDVLYLALEDNPRRLRRRITKLISPFGGEWPERLTLATQWRRLDKGGVEDIEA